MLLIELVLPGGSVGAGEGTWTRDPDDVRVRSHGRFS